MWGAGLEKVEECVLKIQNIIAKYIATRKILDLCEGAMWRPGIQVSKRWR